MIADPTITLACFALALLLAYVGMELYVFPVAAVRRRQAEAVGALKRAKLESDGLRKTLDGSESRIRDLLSRSDALDDNLRHHIQRMPQRDQAALQALVTDGSFGSLMEVLRRGLLFDRQISGLQQVWRPGRNTSERDATKALVENLWVLEPSLVSEGHVFNGKSLGIAAGSYFGAGTSADDLSEKAARKRPSAIGVFRRRSLVAQENDKGERTLVIIEARRPGEAVGRVAVETAIGYAHGMRKLVPELREWAIECWVVAGAIDNSAQLAATNAPPGTWVHLVTWESLLDQARMRRPETVEYKKIRFDDDSPPSFRAAPRGNGLKAILDMDGPDATPDDHTRNHASVA